MKLSDLISYNPVTIQCHDNPDADAIASGFGLYTYFKEAGKEVRFIYSGRNKIEKPNLCLMLEHLEIPIEYVEAKEITPVKGLLITVDCQYGAGNVTKLMADKVAVIDHHQVEITDLELCEINSSLGSCSTLVWEMLGREGVSITDTKLGTALYYGLYTDTNQFSEIFNPLDMDLREGVPVEKSLIQLFRNSNLSLNDLETAGIALIRHIYNDDYKYAIIHSHPCDPNILGLISDLLLQVAEVHTCVVYNEQAEGYKFSVRSCIKEVQANELAAFLADGIGTGGGHYEKAGGFISKARYEEIYPTLHTEAFFSRQLNDYFDNCRILIGEEQKLPFDDMEIYRKKEISLGYIEARELFPEGTPITIRTLEGDMKTGVRPDLILRIGTRGEVYLETEESFERIYQPQEDLYGTKERMERLTYKPVAHNTLDGTVCRLMNYAKVCTSRDGCVYARKLTERVKVFPTKEAECYQAGNPGDYLTAAYNGSGELHVVKAEDFCEDYEPAEIEEEIE